MEFEIKSIQTHAGFEGESNNLIQWAEIKLLIPKGFDWKAGAPKVLKKLQQATELIGKGSEGEI